VRNAPTSGEYRQHFIPVFQFAGLEDFDEYPHIIILFGE
jgi:hypothetical protein